MGMDVYGDKPTTTKGEYFRANVWSWRPIRALIEIANVRNKGRIVDEETMALMRSNDGAGLKTQEECNALANAMEHLLSKTCFITEHGLEIVENDGERCVNFPLDPDRSMCDKAGRFYKQQDIIDGKVKEEDLESPYSVEFSHVRELITFLRSCGGFRVC